VPRKFRDKEGNVVIKGSTIETKIIASNKPVDKPASVVPEAKPKANIKGDK